MASADADLAALVIWSAITLRLLRAARSASVDPIHTPSHPFPWREVYISIPPVEYVEFPIGLTNILPATKL